MSARAAAGRRAIGLAGLFAVMCFVAAGPRAHAQAPELEIHSLQFYVHEDTLATLGGMAAVTTRLETAIDAANDLLEGGQGPGDSPCCTRLEIDGAVQTLVDPNADPMNRVLRSIDFPQEVPDLLGAIGNPSSGNSFFLVDDLASCAGSAGAVGCAQLPNCGALLANPVAVITLDAIDQGVLAHVIAHERGHHACLDHDDTDPCQLMRSSAGGGCTAANQCALIRTAADRSGAACACHASSGLAAPDTQACTDLESNVSGICSGAVCAEVGTDASVSLLAAGDPDFAEFTPAAEPSAATPDRALEMSALTGDWADSAALAAGLEAQGLAYAHDRDLLYAAVPNGSFDALLVLDPQTRAIETQLNFDRTGSIIALAYHPGATSLPDDDRLFALEDQSGVFERLLEIDIDTGATLLIESGVFTGLPRGGELSFGSNGGTTGLAYDSANDALYVASWAGLFEIDYASCGPLTNCAMTEIRTPSDGTLARYAAGLAYSADTGQLYLVGNQTQGTTLFTVIDGATATAFEPIGIASNTVGGLAALPVPEPGPSGPLAAGLALAALRSRATASRPAQREAD